jgi:excisionase family DNA binding protein
MLLGVARTTAYESVRRGEIPAVRLGQRLVVPKSAVAEMLGVAPKELVSLASPANPPPAPEPARRRPAQRTRQETLWPAPGPESTA